jgi:hypothetical protein
MYRTPSKYLQAPVRPSYLWECARRAGRCGLPPRPQPGGSSGRRSRRIWARRSRPRPWNRALWRGTSIGLACCSGESNVGGPTPSRPRGRWRPRQTTNATRNPHGGTTRHGLGRKGGGVPAKERKKKSRKNQCIVVVKVTPAPAPAALPALPPPNIPLAWLPTATGTVFNPPPKALTPEAAPPGTTVGDG